MPINLTCPKLTSPFGWWCIVAIVGLATGLRVWSINGTYEHFDEKIAVGMSQHLERTPGWDNNWKGAEIPYFSGTDQYNFSAYLYTTHVFRRAVEPFAPETLRMRQGLYLHRLFSVLAGAAAVAAIMFVAWQWWGPAVGIVAGLLMALNPQLVQDAHYARPETFMTLMFTLLLWLGFLPAERSWRPVAMAGLVGVLTATKVNNLVLAVLPVWALWELRATREGPHWWRVAGATLLALVGGWSFGVPYAVIHWSRYLTGLGMLAGQYGGSHPPHSLPDHAAVWSLMRRFYISTHGVPWLMAMAAGIVFTIVRRRWRDAMLLCVPVLASIWLFGGQRVFFERNLSVVLPAALLLVALASVGICDGLLGGTRWRAAMIAGVALALSLTGDRVLKLFLCDSLLGDETARMAAYDEALARDFPATRRGVTSLFEERDLSWIQGELEAGRGEFVMTVIDFNDAYKGRWLPVVAQRFRLMPLAEFHGVFADYPPSAFNVFHGPRFLTYWVRAR